MIFLLRTTMEILALLYVFTLAYKINQIKSRLNVEKLTFSIYNRYINIQLMHSLCLQRLTYLIQ